MKVENKICFFLNWVREIGFYQSIIKKIDKSKIIFIINDLNIGLRSNKSNVIKINEELKKNSFKYVLLSKILNKKKYKILLSTGDLGISKLTLASILRFLYSKTIGLIFEKLQLNIFFKKYFKREFTCGGKNCNIYENTFVEKKLSKISIKYPNGLDRNIKNFPNKKWRNNFDVYFVLTDKEYGLIKKKFHKKKVYNIKNLIFKKKNRKLLRKKFLNEFGLSSKKKLVYCLPNERIMIDQNFFSIEIYLKLLERLNKKFNVILRPHPKLLFTKPSVIKLIKKAKIKIDFKNNRNIQDAIICSDLIICDYGNSVVETIFMKRKALIYNWQNQKNFEILYEKQNCIDGILNKKLKNLDFTKRLNETAMIKIFEKLIKNTDYQKKINYLNKNFFFEKNKKYEVMEVLKDLYENN